MKNDTNDPKGGGADEARAPQATPEVRAKATSMLVEHPEMKCPTCGGSFDEFTMACTGCGYSLLDFGEDPEPEAAPAEEAEPEVPYKSFAEGELLNNRYKV